MVQGEEKNCRRFILPRFFCLSPHTASVRNIDKYWLHWVIVISAREAEKPEANQNKEWRKSEHPAEYSHSFIHPFRHFLCSAEWVFVPSSSAKENSMHALAIRRPPPLSQKLLLSSNWSSSFFSSSIDRTAVQVKEVLRRRPRAMKVLHKSSH